MKKRFFGALLALCLCVALLPVVSMAEEPEDGEWEPTEEEWALLECTDEEVAALTLEQQAQRLALAEKLGISTLDGESSAATFYISTAAQLADLAQKVNANANYGVNILDYKPWCEANFVQVADIDLAAYYPGATVGGISYPNGWVPIGTDESFKGNYTVQKDADGKYYEISGLTINGGDAVGLFGSVYHDATIQGVQLRNCSISGGYVGGVVAKLYGGTVKYCSMVGTISGSNCGGIVGYAQYYNVGSASEWTPSKITDCYARGTITATGRAGGIIGEIQGYEVSNNSNRKVGAEVTYCWTDAAISGADVGGIAGFVVRGGDVNHCAVLKASLTATTSADYMSGHYTDKVNGNYYSSWTSITNPVNHYDGAVSVTISETGTNATNWLNATDSGVGGNATATAQSFSNGTFLSGASSEWNRSTTAAYPFPGFGEVLPFSITGTSTGSWESYNWRDSTGKVIIDSPEKLSLLNAYLTGGGYLGVHGEWVDIVQTADIDMTGYSFTPIGTQANYFMGTYNGGGHSITGLVIAPTEIQPAGLFGWIGEPGDEREFTISNVDLRGYTITDKNITATLSETSATTYAGGLVGYSDANTPLKITNCSTTGTISGVRYWCIGGIIGGGLVDIENCYTGGTLKATKCGGILGYADGPVNSTGSIKNSYSAAKLYGNPNNLTKLGGIVGDVSTIAAVTIENCAALNPVISIPSDAPAAAKKGTFVHSDADATVEECYAWAGLPACSGAAKLYVKEGRLYTDPDCTEQYDWSGFSFINKTDKGYLPNLSGHQRLTLELPQQVVGPLEVVVELAQTSYDYDGTAKTPAVTRIYYPASLTGSDGEPVDFECTIYGEVPEGQDNVFGNDKASYNQESFAFEYLDNVNAGTGKVHVTYYDADKTVTIDTTKTFTINKLTAEWQTVPSRSTSYGSLYETGSAHTDYMQAGTVKTDIADATKPQGTAKYYTVKHGSELYEITTERIDSVELSTWSDTVPGLTEAGTYDIYYAIQGTGNYKDSAREKLGEVTIHPAYTLTYQSSYPNSGVDATGTTKTDAVYTDYVTTARTTNPLYGGSNFTPFVGWELTGWKITAMEGSSSTSIPSIGRYRIGTVLKLNQVNDIGIAVITNLSMDKFTGDATLQAQWEPAEYTITFDTDGGSLNETTDGVTADGSNYKTTYTYGTGKATLPQPIRDGYDFQGWYKVEDGEMTATKVTSISTTDYGNITLKATWKRTVYTVTYNMNAPYGSGGEDASGEFILGGTFPAEKQKDEPLTIAGKSFTILGYEQIGWTTSSVQSEQFGSNKVEYEFGSSYTGNADLTLYAVYDYATYNITYDLNYGDAPADKRPINYDNEREHTTYQYSKTVDTTLDAASWPGYTFKGWLNTATDVNIGTTIPKGTYGDLTLKATWEPIRYALTYILHGGTYKEGESNPLYYTVETETFSLVAPVKTGYRFKGWLGYVTDSDPRVYPLGGSGYTATKTIEKGARHNPFTFEAGWELVNYTIEYTVNHGTNATSNPSTYTYESVKITLADPTPDTGYKFEGWYTDYNFAADTKVTEITAGSTDDLHLYAKIVPIEYSIAYTLNSGAFESWAVHPESYNVETATFQLPEPVKTGYTFDGWTWHILGQAVSATPEKDLSIQTGSTGDREYIANWSPVTYQVVFKPNNATGGSMSNQPLTYNRSAYLTGNSFTRTGYTFTGWNTAAGGTGTSYTNQQQVLNLADTQDAEVELYAQWTANSYTVKFDGNGADGGSMSDQSFTYDEAAKALTANGFTRTGYTFTGWNTAADGTGTAYTNGQEVSNLTATDGGEVKLYAQWEVIEYSISYELNGGMNPPDLADKFTVESAKITLPTPVKMGYTFGGWFDNASFSSAVTEIPAGSTGDKTFYAKWTANSYTVKFDGNGGDGSMSDQSFTYDEAAKALTANGFTRTGYTFTGWNTVAGGTGTAYTNGQEVSNLTATDDGEVKLYAQWEVIEYSISYELNGGMNPPDLADKFTVESAKIALPTPVKMGYTFGGWFDNASFSGSAVTEIPAGSTGDKTFHAKWTANSYTVKFNANGGDGSMSDQSFTYDAAQNLTANGFTRTGYTFTGWNTAAGGTGTAYTNGQEVSNLTATDGGEVKLYAQWRAHTYTVQFDGNGADSGSMEAQSFTYDEAAKALTENGFTRTGYTFTGWNTVAGGTGTAYTNGQEVSNLTETDDGEVKLYAQWRAHTYTVQFNANGGTGSMDDQSFTYDEAAKALTENGFTRTGYNFTGWNTAADGTGDAYAGGASVRNLTATDGGEVKLYAQWSLNTYTVTYEPDDNTNETASQHDTKTYGVDLRLKGAIFTRNHFQQTGWVNKTDADETYGLEVFYTTNSNLILRPVWKELYLVTFQTNMSGSTVDPAHSRVDVNGKLTLEKLPTPTRPDRYLFEGWFDAASGGTRITLDTVFTADTTVYAQWKRIPPAKPGGSDKTDPDGTDPSDPDGGNNPNDPNNPNNPDGGKNPNDPNNPDGGKNPNDPNNPNGGKNPGFPDVPDDSYFKEPVDWAASEGITNGNNGYFDPYGNCTRAHAVTFLWRAVGSPKAKTASMPFSDVKKGSYYEQAVLWASENDIVLGYADGTFRPNNLVTRQQVAAILWRFAKDQGMDVSAGKDTSIRGYHDVNLVSSYAIEAMQWAVGDGILQGSRGYLLPRNNCTRAQIVTFLWRLLVD